MAQAAATKTSKRKRIYVNENVSFPWDSADPDEWRCKPREPYDAPFNPDRPPGTKGYGISSFDAPGSIFCTLMSEPLRMLLEETNRHGRKRCEAGEVGYKWKDIDEAEFIVFMALIVAQGGCKKSDYDQYWTDKGLNATPGYSQVMSLRRFKQIKQNLHFVNDSDAILRGWNNKDDPNYDAIYKIRRYFDITYERLHEGRAPGKNLSYDEQMVLFCGRSCLRVHMKCKPIQNGFKLYLLTDSDSGYPLSCIIHAGEYAQDTGSLTFRKVWEGLEKGNVLDQGFFVYVDSYYTSLEMVEACYERDVFVVGMLKGSMCAGLPPVITDRYSKFSQSLKKGEAAFLHTNKYTLCNWSDSANAIMLNSLPNVIEEWTTCTRREKLAGAKVRFVVRNQPLCFNYYNMKMGGVDKQGQLVKNSSRPYRAKKWYLSLGHHCIDAAVTSTYIIMKDGIMPGSNSRLTVRKARELIVRDLLTMSHRMGRQLPPALIARREVLIQQEQQLLRLSCQQHLVEKRTRARCKGHVQTKSTTQQCATCKVPLCIACFKRYHTMVDYKYDDPKKRNQRRKNKPKK